jgi:hypothetical protein
MTEAEWLSGADPEPMLTYLLGRPDPRRLRLFACACVRRVWPLLTDERSRRAVEVAERFADGRAAEEERRTAEREAQRALEDMTDRCGGGLDTEAVPEPCAALNAVEAARAFQTGDSLARHAALNCRDAVADDPDEAGRQCQLLREMFGNPFRPEAFDSSWVTPAVADLARAVYDQGSWGDLPALADALAEAGCDEPTLLGHLRGRGAHARGCWVLDLLLEKT